MPSEGNHHPGGEEHYDLTVEVPRDIRHHHDELQAYLNKIAMQLLEAEEISIAPDAEDAPIGDTESVKVTMLIRPCAPRMPAGDDDDNDGDDDDTHGPPGDQRVLR